MIGWNTVVGNWSRVEGTAQQPNPNAPFSKIVSGQLFDDDGRLIPSITVLGKLNFSRCFIISFGYNKLPGIGITGCGCDAYLPLGLSFLVCLLAFWCQ